MIVYRWSFFIICFYFGSVNLGEKLLVWFVDHGIVVVIMLLFLLAVYSSRLLLSVRAVGFQRRDVC